MPAWLLIIFQLLPNLIGLIRDILSGLPNDQKRAMKAELKEALKGDPTTRYERVQQVLSKYR